MPQAGGDKRTRIGWVPWRKRGLQGQTILALCFALTAMNAITDQLEWGEDTLLFLSCFLNFFSPPDQKLHFLLILQSPHVAVKPHFISF